MRLDKRNREIYIYRYIHTCIHTYIHIYIHTYIQKYLEGGDYLKSGDKYHLRTMFIFDVSFDLFKSRPIYVPLPLTSTDLTESTSHRHSSVEFFQMWYIVSKVSFANFSLVFVGPCKGRASNSIIRVDLFSPSIFCYISCVMFRHWWIKYCWISIW